VGTPRQTQIAPLELPRYGGGRLSGIRCIATHLKPETPSEAALTAMAIQRLDALVWLTLSGGGFQRRGGGATGYIQETYLAHLIPQGDGPNFEFSVLSAQLEPDATDEIEEPSIQKSLIQTPHFPWKISEPLNLDELADQDFLDLVEGLEAEFEAEFVASRSMQTKTKCCW